MSIGELSDRQFEAARHAAEGLTISEVGEMMGCSARTAKQHLDQARRKLGVEHKRELGRALKRIEGGTE